MVQEWLSAHITMKNKPAQERLLAETLRRVFVVGPQPGFFKIRKRGTVRKWASTPSTGIDQSLEEAALDLGARPFSSRRKLGEPRLRLALG